MLVLIVTFELAAPATGQGAQSGGGAGSGIQAPSLGMTGHADELFSLTTPKLGMTGYEDELIELTTPKLGMTGHRDELIDLTTPKLGMTGHQDELIRLTTPKIGMTGWRGDPARVTTPMLGMTGWRGERDAPPPIVCIGGQVTNLAASGGPPKYACSCPTARTARAVGSSYQNTFQCIPDALKVPPPPKIACIGGVVRSGKCVCAAGKTPKLAQYAISGNAPAWRCEDIAPVRVADPPKIVCTGGSVRNNACVCQAGFAPVKTGATSFRCERVAILPPVTTPKFVAPTRVNPQPQIACAGGLVRSNVCVCPGGTKLQNGVCRAAATSVPLRGVVPQRVR